MFDRCPMVAAKSEQTFDNEEQSMKTIIRVPLSTIIRITLDHIRDQGIGDLEDVITYVQDWKHACEVCGIPTSFRNYSEEIDKLSLEEQLEREEDDGADPFFRDVNIRNWQEGLVYEAKGQKFLVVAVVRSEEDTVYVAPAEHFIFDVELGPFDYEELAQNIRAGWPKWMKILERRKSGGRVPLG